MCSCAFLQCVHRVVHLRRCSDDERGRGGAKSGPLLKSRVPHPDTMRMTAFHEAGHTLTAMLTKNASVLHKVTILPRGHSGGAVRHPLAVSVVTSLTIAAVVLARHCCCCCCCCCCALLLSSPAIPCLRRFYHRCACPRLLIVCASHRRTSCPMTADTRLARSCWRRWTSPWAGVSRRR
jgi:hypothetical protein